MQPHLAFYAGSKHLFFDSLVIVDEHAKPGDKTVKVRWVHDTLRRVTWDAKIEHLKPVLGEERHAVTVH
jgi:hypothetical protein